MNDPLCFYDVLADYYVQVPESGKPILDLIVKLWSQSFTCHIFTLLFHKWVGYLDDAFFWSQCDFHWWNSLLFCFPSKISWRIYPPSGFLSFYNQLFCTEMDSTFIIIIRCRISSFLLGFESSDCPWKLSKHICRWSYFLLFLLFH